MRRSIVPAMATVAALGAILLQGGEPFGRIALRAGLPSLAMPLLDDPAAKGAAFYRAGRYDKAIAAFTEAGALYDLGNAHARKGDFAEALLAWDQLLVRDPGHADARANFNLIASVYSGTKLELNGPLALPEKKEGDTGESEQAQGSARASGQGDEAEAGTDFFQPELKPGLARRNVRQPFDDMFIAANERWLVTLEDLPGKYLAARLKAEQERRRALGIAVPEGGDPW